MNIHRAYQVLSPIFRRRRIKQFIDWLAPNEETRILDIGGYPGNWDDIPVQAKLTVLNPHIVPGLAEKYKCRYEVVTGDGTNLPYADGEFDIVFSNSVIEHVGTLERQRQFAGEARRVGKRLWVQTPARSFFIEPHLLTPFLHWLPHKVQRKLLRHGTVWGWITKPSKAEVENFLNEVRLLTRSEMKELFPDCHIHTERVVGLAKSYVAVRR